MLYNVSYQCCQAHTYTNLSLYIPSLPHYHPPIPTPTPSPRNTHDANAGVTPCNACPKGTICRTEPLFCINPPCGPDRVRCLNPDKICTLDPETGPCKALFRKFFYNSTTDQCELFIYGGCGGNDNRFDTRSECISACGKQCCCLYSHAFWNIKSA